MVNCDICNREITEGYALHGVLVSLANYMPPAARQRAALFGVSPDEMHANLMAKAKVDTTPWIACEECVPHFLGAEPEKAQARDAAAKLLRGEPVPLASLPQTSSLFTAQPARPAPSKTMTCRQCGKQVDYAERLRMCPHCGTYDPGWVLVMPGTTDPVAQKLKTNAGNYYQQGRKREAIAEFSRAAEIDPSDATIFSNIGAIHMELGEYEAAASFFEKALALDPDLGPAKRQLQRVRERMQAPAPAQSSDVPAAIVAQTSTPVGQPAAGAPRTAETGVALIDAAARARQGEPAPGDSGLFAKAEALLAGDVLQPGPKAVLLLQLCRWASVFRYPKLGDYLAQLQKLEPYVPPSERKDLADLQAELATKTPGRPKAAKGFAVELLAEIEAALQASASDPQGAGQRLLAVDENLRQRFWPFGKGPVWEGLVRAWVKVDRRAALGRMKMIPKRVQGQLVSDMQKASPLENEEWMILDKTIGRQAAVEVVKKLLSESCSNLHLPAEVLETVAKGLRMSLVQAYGAAQPAPIVSQALSDYETLLGALPAEVGTQRSALWEELYRMVAKTAPPKLRWAIRFSALPRVVQYGVRAGHLTETALNNLIPLTPPHVADFVKSTYFAESADAQDAAPALQALQRSTGNNPVAIAWFLVRLLGRGLGIEALRVAQMTQQAQEMTLRVRRAWLSQSPETATAAISPSDMPGDPVGGFLAQKSLAEQVEFLQSATRNGAESLPGPMWVVPIDWKPGGIKGFLRDVAAKGKPPEVQAEEYVARTPLYNQVLPAGAVKEADQFAEYVRIMGGYAEYEFQTLDLRLLQALVAWGDQNPEQVESLARAMWDAIRPADFVLYVPWLASALLTRCIWVLAAAPKVLVEDCLGWVGKEWKPRKVKQGGQEVVLGMPKERLFSNCYSAALHVDLHSPRRRDEIIRRGLQAYDSGSEDVTEAAYWYGKGKPALELTPPIPLKGKLEAAWQLGIVRRGLKSLGAAMERDAWLRAEGTDAFADVHSCDICNSLTPRIGITVIPSDEFLKIVAAGFDPGEDLVRQEVGLPRDQLLERWEHAQVVQLTSDWRLCPKCAARARIFRMAG